MSCGHPARSLPLSLGASAGVRQVVWLWPSPSFVSAYKRAASRLWGRRGRRFLVALSPPLPLPRLSLSAPTAVAANINPESVASHTVASSAQYSSVLASRDGVPGQMFAAMAWSRSPRGTGRGKPPPAELQLAESDVAPATNVALLSNICSSVVILGSCKALAFTSLCAPSASVFVQLCHDRFLLTLYAVCCGFCIILKIYMVGSLNLTLQILV